MASLSKSSFVSPMSLTEVRMIDSTEKIAVNGSLIDQAKDVLHSLYRYDISDIIVNDLSFITPDKTKVFNNTYTYIIADPLIGKYSFNADDRTFLVSPNPIDVCLATDLVEMSGLWEICNEIVRGSILPLLYSIVISGIPNEYKELIDGKFNFTLYAQPVKQDKVSEGMAFAYILTTDSLEYDLFKDPSANFTSIIPKIARIDFDIYLSRRVIGNRDTMLHELIHLLQAATRLNNLLRQDPTSTIGQLETNTKLVKEPFWGDRKEEIDAEIGRLIHSMSAYELVASLFSISIRSLSTTKGIIDRYLSSTDSELDAIYLRAISNELVKAVPSWILAKFRYELNTREASKIAVEMIYNKILRAPRKELVSVFSKLVL